MSSAAQLVDGVSRGDMALPRAQGWLRGALELEELWDLLAEAILWGSVARAWHVDAPEDAVHVARARAPPVSVG